MIFFALGAVSFAPTPALAYTSSYSSSSSILKSTTAISTSIKMPRTTEKSELQNNLLETAKSLMLLDAEPDDVEPFLLITVGIDT